MIFTSRDLAQAFGVTRQRACQWLKAGRVPGAQKKGRDWVIDVAGRADLTVDGIEPPGFGGQGRQGKSKGAEDESQ